MSDIRELYQELILDHSKRPRNKGPLEGTTHEADGHNPLCGDKVHVSLIVRDGIIEDVHFDGSGCAISTASASVMTEILKGKPLDEIPKILQCAQHLLTGECDAPPGGASILGKMRVFAGVREFPLRVKCATLAWHTAKAAMNHKKDESTSTE